MKSTISILLLILIRCSAIYGQNTSDTTYIKVGIKVGLEDTLYSLDTLKSIASYDYVCISSVPDSANRWPQEGITHLTHINDTIELEAVLIEECRSADEFYPKLDIFRDTLFIDWLAIAYIEDVETRMEDGSIVSVVVMPGIELAECDCAFRARLKFYAPVKLPMIINGKDLVKQDGFFRTSKVKHYLHERDTIGYIDKYGRIQGAKLIKETKEGNQIRAVYTNGIIVSYELCSKDGQVLVSESDFDIFFDKVEDLESSSDN